MQISCMRARHLFQMWLEENDPIEFLKANGVVGDGDLDRYHCISMNCETGQVFYEQKTDLDQDPNCIEVIGIHDGDTFESSGIGDRTTEEWLEDIAAHYWWFSDAMHKQRMEYMEKRELINKKALK